MAVGNHRNKVISELLLPRVDSGNPAGDVLAVGDVVLAEGFAQVGFFVDYDEEQYGDEGCTYD